MAPDTAPHEEPKHFKTVKAGQISMGALSTFHKNLLKVDGKIRQIYKLIAVAEQEEFELRENFMDLAAQAVGFKNRDELREFLRANKRTHRFVLEDETGEVVLQKLDEASIEEEFEAAKNAVDNAVPLRG